MNKMSLNHPSIIKLYNKTISKMNYNLLISVFGVNQGIRIIKGNLLNQKMNSQLSTHSSSNLILSNEIKSKFEAKNKAFITVTKRVLNQIGKNVRKSIILQDSIINQKRGYQAHLFQRFNNQNSQIRYQIYIITIIKLQANIRAYLSRRTIQRIINNMIIEKSTKCIISVQSHFRQFNQLKKTKIEALQKKVIDERKEKCNVMINQLYSYYQSINNKKKVIIDKLLNDRKEKIILIQGVFKKVKLMKLVKTIIAYEKNNYVLTYPFYSKRIQIKLYLDTHFGLKSKYKFIIPLAPKYKLYSFEFCRLRKMFVLYIKKEELVAGKYRCQLIVDGCVTCDGRFPHFECEDGQFYNLIEFNQGKVAPSGETKKTNGSDNESKDSLSDKNNKKYISRDEEDKKVYSTLKKNLEANPPNCLYNKKWIKNICLDYANETQDDFFTTIRKNK